MPSIPHAVLTRLAEALATGAGRRSSNLRGPPGASGVVLSGLFKTLRALTGDEGARAVLPALGLGLILVNSDDDGVLFDVDRPGHLDEGPG